jgi:hypothetical protein
MTLCVGILRLRFCFAARSKILAQDDKEYFSTRVGYCGSEAARLKPRSICFHVRMS